MRVKKIIYALFALMLLLKVAPIRVFAETRNIYVVDIITLKIESREFSAEELTEKFKGFEVVELKDDSGGYAISLRTFESGEYKISLGSQEIIITVQSTLDDIQREELFEGDSRVTEPGFLFHWRILFCIFTSISVLSGGFILVKIFMNRKIKMQTPIQLFLSCSGSLSVENDNYFVYLTYYFKEYIGSLYQCRIIGKTSAEIISELKEIQVLKNMLAEIQEWLTVCDRFKFTGVKVSSEEKQGYYNKKENLPTRLSKVEQI